MDRNQPAAIDLAAELFRRLEACGDLLAEHRRRLTAAGDTLDRGQDQAKAILEQPL